MNNINIVQFWDTLAYLQESVANPVILEHAKRSAMFPYFMLASEHLCEKVKIQIIFEGGN